MIIFTFIFLILIIENFITNFIFSEIIMNIYYISWFDSILNMIKLDMIRGCLMILGVDKL